MSPGFDKISNTACSLSLHSTSLNQPNTDLDDSGATGQPTQENSSSNITMRHLMLAVRCDQEIDELFGRCAFVGSGQLPHIPIDLCFWDTYETMLGSSPKCEHECNWDKYICVSGAKPLGSDNNLGEFCLAGGTGYAADVNGTYVVAEGELAGGKAVYRQVENPQWWFEFILPADESTVHHEDDEVAEKARAGGLYTGWVAKWTQARGARCGYLRSVFSPGQPVGDSPVTVQSWEVMTAGVEGSTSDLCDWADPTSWLMEFDCPRFRRAANLRLQAAGRHAIAVATRKRNDVSEALRQLQDGSVKPPAVKVEDPSGEGYGVYHPVDGVFVAGRPVYRQQDHELHYDEVRGSWTVHDGDRFVPSSLQTCTCARMPCQQILHAI